MSLDALFIHTCRCKNPNDQRSCSHKLEVEDAHLNTPLLMAAAKGSSEAMDILIQKGAQLTRTDGKGNNIVHLMVSNDQADALKVRRFLVIF